MCQMKRQSHCSNKDRQGMKLKKPEMQKAVRNEYQEPIATSSSCHIQNLLFLLSGSKEREQKRTREKEAQNESLSH